MKNLISPTIKVTQAGKTQLLTMPYSRIFWQDGERISMEAVLEKLNAKKDIEVRQLTLGEAFEAETKSKNYICPTHFSTEDEHFNYWLRVMLDYDFSNVDEKTYTNWYSNLNKGVETSYL